MAVVFLFVHIFLLMFEENFVYGVHDFCLHPLPPCPPLLVPQSLWFCFRSLALFVVV